MGSTVGSTVAGTVHHGTGSDPQGSRISGAVLVEPQRQFPAALTEHAWAGSPQAANGAALLEEGGAEDGQPGALLAGCTVPNSGSGSDAARRNGAAHSSASHGDAAHDSALYSSASVTDLQTAAVLQAAFIRRTVTAQAAGYDDSLRRQALDLLRAGHTKAAVAKQIGVHRNTVARWAEEGDAAGSFDSAEPRS